MSDFLYQKTVYQGYIISDLIDEVASYRVHKNELEARIDDLLAQLEQREQEVADLTAKGKEAVKEADNQHKKYCQLAREYDEEKDSQSNLFKVLNARIAELVDQLSQAKQGVQWHDASEQPERWPVLAERKYGDESAWDVYTCLIPDFAARWCYIDEVK